MNLVFPGDLLQDIGKLCIKPRPSSSHAPFPHRKTFPPPRLDTAKAQRSRSHYAGRICKRRFGSKSASKFFRPPYLEKLKNTAIVGHFGLSKIRTGEYQNCYHVIVFQKLRFEMCCQRFQISPDWRAFNKLKLRFRDGLVWTEGL